VRGLGPRPGATLSVDHPWVAALALLGLLPLWRSAGRPIGFSWIALVPRDPLSDVVDWSLRVAHGLAVALLAFGLAGTHLRESRVERVGSGAEVALLLDRSRSMDQPFARVRNGSDTSAESKSLVAERALSGFAAGRTHDAFSLTVFSSTAIRVLDFTDKQEAVQAAIRAHAIGRGLADTDMGRALLSVLAQFDDRPYSGSRLVLLVSDGGAQLDSDTREAIVRAARRNRVGLYWIYIRSAFSPGLSGEAGEAPDDTDTVPERSLNRFFRQLGTPYRAYEAEDPAALGRAVADVDRLERLPLAYADIVPRRDLSGALYAAAALLCLAIAAAVSMERRPW
jgi:mxaC protein